MTINRQAVAVEGVGFGRLSMALRGWLIDQIVIDLEGQPDVTIETFMYEAEQVAARMIDQLGLRAWMVERNLTEIDLAEEAYYRAFGIYRPIKICAAIQEDDEQVRAIASQAETVPAEAIETQVYHATLTEEVESL